MAPDGTVKTTYIHSYGVEVASPEEWNERGASGQIIKQHKDGSIETQSWQKGILHGLSTMSFPHSNIVHREVYYDNGARVWQTVHYASGMPKRQDIFRPGNVTVVSTWYEDGAPRSSEEYRGDNIYSGEYFTPQQELETQVTQGNGERIRRDGHGQLLAKDDIENGKKVLEIVYFSNGMPQKYIPYVNDEIEGTLKTFYAGGEPATVETWKKNRQHGDMTLFRSGERVAIVPYVDGQKEGIETGFRPGTDTITEEISWKAGLKHGPSVYWVDQEKVTDYYYQGEKVSRRAFFDRGGMG
jgi:antitoxin component YwqK of YwqJK toxin-antitoxin module